MDGSDDSAETLLSNGGMEERRDFSEFRFIMNLH